MSQEVLLIVGVMNPHLLAASDNVYDIGQAGSARPRNVYVSGFVSTSFQILTKASASYAIPTAEVGAHYDNNGAGAQVAFTLRASSPGLVYSFFVATGQNVRVSGNGSDTIRIGSAVSTASTGHIDSATVGSYTTLACHQAGQWVQCASSGSPFSVT